MIKKENLGQEEKEESRVQQEERVPLKEEVEKNRREKNTSKEPVTR